MAYEKKHSLITRILAIFLSVLVTGSAVTFLVMLITELFAK